MCIPSLFFNRISFRWKTFVFLKLSLRLYTLCSHQDSALVSSSSFDSWNCATVLGLVFFACHYFHHATPQSKSKKPWWVENRSRRSVSTKEEEWNSTGTEPYDRTMAITSTRSLTTRDHIKIGIAKGREKENRRIDIIDLSLFRIEIF